MMTDTDVYRYLIDVVQPIYADLVAALGEKPTQVVFQFEAAFVHLAVAQLNADVQQENLKKALHHLQRAALDSAKILWLHKKRQVAKVIDDRDVRKFCINLSESRLMEAYRAAEEQAREARRIEVKGTGVDPNAAITAYYHAVLAFDEVLQAIDIDKIQQFQRYRLFYILRTQSLGFVIGILSSVTAAGLLGLTAWFYRTIPT